jgi:trehalose-6-phosphate synthase
MLSNNIHPIILELPDYDINKAYQKQKKIKKVLRDTYMYFTGYPKDCKNMFRTSLNDMINKKGYNDNVSIIRYKSWNNNYSEDLSSLYQEDGIHLNDAGYEKLDCQIAQTICQLITANR